MAARGGCRGTGALKANSAGNCCRSAKRFERGHANVMWSQQSRGRGLAGAVSKTFP
jgi:hypothetical protein